jgi:antitoxin (DNA-binding transcriptional repressor) of toxin-antitoxin stability system
MFHMNRKLSPEVSVADLRCRFAAVKERLQSGQILVVTDHGRPLAELRPLHGRQDILGLAAGKGTIRADFDAPLDEGDEGSW